MVLIAPNLVRKPNLFICGAPKCGTTSLASWLDEHPQIYMSPKKEPHHFYSPYGPPMPQDDYLRLFAAAGSQHKMIAEASTWYLFSRVAAARILQSESAAKFVVCLRNPVEMAMSLHSQKRFSGHEIVEDFAEAWALNSERLKGKRIGVFALPQGDISHLAYHHACSLGSQLKSLLDVVPSAQVHTILIDDLRSDSQATWQSLLQFLGVVDDKRRDFPVRNAARRHRSALLNRTFIRLARARKIFGINRSIGIGRRFGKLNAVEEKYRQPSLEVKMQVYESLLQEIEILEEILDRSFEHWSPELTNVTS